MGDFQNQMRQNSPHKFRLFPAQGQGCSIRRSEPGITFQKYGWEKIYPTISKWKEISHCRHMLNKFIIILCILVYLLDIILVYLFSVFIFLIFSYLVYFLDEMPNMIFQSMCVRAIDWSQMRLVRKKGEIQMTSSGWVGEYPADPEARTCGYPDARYPNHGYPEGDIYPILAPGWCGVFRNLPTYSSIPPFISTSGHQHPCRIKMYRWVE